MTETEDYDKSAIPTAHKTSHQDGGSDEISVLGLSGLLADAQTPLAHKTSHQDGGADEISVTGLSGLLADPQTPIALPKFSAHKNGVDQTAIPTGVDTKVTFLTEEYDDGSSYDAPNSKWIPGIIGKGHISVCILWNATADQALFCPKVYKNGTIYRVSLVRVSGDLYQSVSMSCDVLVSAITDYFEIYVEQTSGTTKNIVGSIDATWLMGHMLV